MKNLGTFLRAYIQAGVDLDCDSLTPGRGTDMLSFSTNYFLLKDGRC